MKLHLGCGRNYLDGYANVEHPSNTHLKADIYCDLRELSFDRGSIDEIFLSHVFEHFDRPTALSLLAKWNAWLKIGGKLIITVPDVEEMFKDFAGLNYADQQMMLRHCFGSHEADWAVHWDGWYKSRFEHVLPKFGFELLNSYQMVFDDAPWRKDITVEAQKASSPDNLSLSLSAYNILKEYASENLILNNMQISWSRQMRWKSDHRSVNDFELSLIKSRSDGVIFDVGAYTGEWSSVVAEKYPHAKFFAFEPQELCFKELNSKFFNSYQSAVGRIDGLVKFYEYENEFMKGCSGLYCRPIISGERHRIIEKNIECVTLDEFCKAHEIHEIDFLKIDVEGAEHDVLVGATSLLSNKKIRAIKIEYGGTFKDAHCTMKQIYDLLKIHGYSIFRMRENDFVYVHEWDDSLEDYKMCDYFAYLDLQNDSVGEVCAPPMTALFFSKDRASQLDLALGTFFKHCQSHCDVQVLYKASDSLTKSQYLRLTDYYPQVKFFEQTDFRNNVIYMIGGYDYVTFCVDDSIFARDFDLNDAITMLDRYRDVIGFSLRLGKNIDYCYMVDQPQSFPEDYVQIGDIVLFDWTRCEHDFGYPMELSSSVYRADDVLNLIYRVPFNDPNTMEIMIHSLKAELPGKNMLACYAKSVAFANAINKVQTRINNRSGSLDHRFLANQFTFGLRLVDIYNGYDPKSPHEELDVQFKLENLTTTNPKLSIIIVSYNGYKHLLECVKSVFRNTNNTFEMIVVDNHKDDLVREFVSQFKDVRLIFNEENVGPAAGRNQALPFANSEYVVFLDDDVIVPRNWDSKFLGYMKQYPYVGMIGPVSNRASGPQQIDMKVGYGNNLYEYEKYAEMYSVYGTGVVRVARLVSFCMFMRRSVIETLGSMDERFGKYGFEDDDYSLRSYIAGFNPIVATSIYVHHTGGPIKDSDLEYRQYLKYAWEQFKAKWRIPTEVEYEDANYAMELVNQKFDQRKHHIPLMKVAA